jgi:hypothetical protein
MIYTLVAAIAATALATFGVVRGTWAVGGSDSSCYGLMAKAFASGELQPSSSLAVDAPWPNAAITFAPGGFIPSSIHPDAAAPICAPGMSVLMAPLASVFGQDAIFWLTPIAASVLVLAAFKIARDLAGGAAGAMAAILTATSPIVLYQAVQPMNDVVTAALWLAALACAVRLKADPHRDKSEDPHKNKSEDPYKNKSEDRYKNIGGDIHRNLWGPALAGPVGILIGLAIMVRPNLAPLAVIVALVACKGGTSQEWLRRLAVIAVGSLPGIAIMLWLNNALYGSAFSSGYGAASRLFATSHIQANLTNYSRALFETQNVVPLCGLLAPFVFDGAKRTLSALLLSFAAIVIAIYLLYEPFPEWWYLRFLMPAIVVLLVLASAAVTHVLSRAKMGGLIPIVAIVIGVLGVRAAGKHDAFALQAMESRYRESAEAVRDRLPANTVLITEWQSGSMRFHAGREVVLWESLDPAWLDRAITWLKSKDLHPYLVFERREEAQFRTRFRPHSDVGGLDWPPRFDINRQVRIFDPDDRARYLAGESYSTENIRPRAGGRNQR